MKFPAFLKNKNFWFTVVVVVGALLGWWNWPSSKDIKVDPPCVQCPCDGDSTTDDCNCGTCPNE